MVYVGSLSSHAGELDHEVECLIAGEWCGLNV